MKDDGQQRRYRAVSAMAVVSLALGFASAITFFDWWFAFVPATGIALGWLALQRIARRPDELAGRTIARAGILVCVVMWAVTYTTLAMTHFAGIPAGYELITYEMLQPDADNPREVIPPGLFEYQNKRVFIEGFISPGRQQTRIKRFILCPRIGHCTFCNPEPTPTERILVVLEGDLSTDYTVHPIHVGGTLRIDPESPIGLPYKLDVDYLR